MIDSAAPAYARIPNELRLVILTCLVKEDPPRGYIWSPDVQGALRSLSRVDHTWRHITLPYLYRRVAVTSASAISSLLSASAHLRWVEALALLPGRVNYITGRTRQPNAHDYCIKDLVSLFHALGPTLDRLFIMHCFLRRYRDCGFSPEYMSCFTTLSELVVDSPLFLVPFSMVTWTNQGFMDWFPACPQMNTVVRLGSNGDRTFWREFEYRSKFPAIEHIVSCNAEGLHMEMMPAWVDPGEPSIAQQLAAKPDLRVTLVDDDHARFGPTWARLITRLPPDRFRVESVESPGDWFIATTLQGTLFDWEEGEEEVWEEDNGRKLHRDGPARLGRS